jgi:DNA helicase-2/ATP-dependent DNA helicase PcrA
MTKFHDDPAMDDHFSGRIDYENELNEAQREAVTALEGPTLVIAGAGSGKTRTIVYRVAWLVEQGIDPSSILLLTFTRKSAEEMLNRASMLLDRRVSRVSGGTFHSTGNLLLRRYGSLEGLDPSFSIMDQADAIESFDHIRRSILPKDALKGFPKARTLAEIVSRAVSENITVEDAIRRRHPHLEPHAEPIERIRKAYGEHKRLNNLVDYDDLLLKTILLLEEHEHVREEITRRWRHVLVDEYQDTNPLQARMLYLVASGHNNVMAVGDDSQSIYSFRGADFRNIMEFPRVFGEARMVKLEENYRSTAPILAVTNMIISRAATGYPKKLFSRRTEGPLPLAVRPVSERGQSRFVLRCIQELKDNGIPLRDVAVLFRAGFHSFDLEGELTRNNIAFVKYGGFKFLESLHIKDVLAHLKVLNNLSDRLSWSRILRIIPGIGVKTALKIAATIAEKGFPRDAKEIVPRTRKYSARLQDLMTLLTELKEDSCSIADKVDRINKYYFPFLKDNYDNYPKRMRDLEHLADLTTQYRSLNRFLNDMALEPPDEDAVEPGTRSNSLVLSTIHSAKGLEWHTVILIWASEGRIPSPMAKESPDELEEERRLLYVAATRAKHNLVIISPRTILDRSQGLIPVRKSRFLEEVPEEYFRTYSLDE